MTSRYPGVSRSGNGWRFRIDVRTSDGRRHRTGRAGFATAKEAAAELDRYREMYAGVIDPTDATLGQYVDIWLEHRMGVGKIRRTTGDQYADSLKLLGDELRGVPLQRLTAGHLDRRYAELLEPNDDGKRRSAGTVRLLHSVVRTALADAVRKGTVSSNVADAADPPAAAQAKPKERRIWSTDDGLAFLRWDGLKLSHRAAWVLVMFCGLRRAEACGLRWSDIDGDELHVRRTRARAAHNEVIIGEPKTAAGRRTVPLPSPAVAVVAEWRRAHTEMMLATGERVEEVLVSSKGQAWHPDLVSQAWRKDNDRAVQAGVVPYRITLHDGRHWYGSHLVAGGVDLRTVAEMIGHADPSFTVRTYAHTDDERKRAAAEVMSRLGS